MAGQGRSIFSLLPAPERLFPMSARLGRSQPNSIAARQGQVTEKDCPIPKLRGRNHDAPSTRRILNCRGGMRKRNRAGMAAIHPAVRRSKDASVCGGFALPFQGRSSISAAGQVVEWLKAPHSKCGIPARVSWVRIPPCPPAKGPALRRAFCWLTGSGGRTIVRRLAFVSEVPSVSAGTRAYKSWRFASAASDDPTLSARRLHVAAGPFSEERGAGTGLCCVGEIPGAAARETRSGPSISRRPFPQTLQK